MSTKTALIAGATGLVGTELVNILLNDERYSQVTILSRKPISIENKKLRLVLEENFDHLEKHTSIFNVNDVYCCLGTTRKNAGSKEAFIKIDLDYPLQMAEIASRQPNFESYLIVTALGSNAESALFYNSTKGKLEDKLIALNLKSLKIFRPSLLLGKRKDFRFTEEIAKGISSFLSFFVIGVQIGRLWSIKAEEVAKSMLIVAKEEKPGLQTFSPKQMVKIANR